MNEVAFWIDVDDAGRILTDLAPSMKEASGMKSLS